jgi:hypothetical protein
MGEQQNFMTYTAHLAVLMIRKMKMTKAQYIFLVEIPIKKQTKVGIGGGGGCPSCTLYGGEGDYLW